MSQGAVSQGAVLGVAGWVLCDLVQLPQKLGVWGWCCMLFDLVQLSQGQGV